jgi:NADP-dependent 3-hydroxy acid dehydrogenase YdfG
MIKSKVIVITGASSGLGAATAKYLAAGGAAIHQVTDVIRKKEVQALVDLALEAYGRVDLMINNAGVMPIAPMSALKTDEWDEMIDINIKGVLNGIAAALPLFLKQQSGHFINLGSVAGRSQTA